MSADQSADQIPLVPAASEGVSTQETTPVPDAPAPITEDAAAKLFDSMVEAQASPTKEAEPTKDAPETPKQEAPKTEPAAEKTEPESPAEPELPKVRHPLAEDDDPELDADPKFTKIHKDFERLREKTYKARQEGAFGRQLVELAQREGVTPERLAELIQKNIRLEKGDPAVTAEIAAELQKRGYRLATDTEAEVATEAKRIFKEQFEEGVKERQIDEEYARKQAQIIAAKLVEARPKPAPTPQQTSSRQAPSNDGLIHAATAEVQQLSSQIEQSYVKAKLDFAPVRAEVERRIIERTQREGTPHPSMWAYIYRQTAAQVQSEMLGKLRESKTPQVRATNTLTPSTKPRQDTASREAYMKSIADSL